MATLTWDGIGNRYYETGVDRGVFYDKDGQGIAWSGLTEVVEDYPDFDTTPRYLDGIKYVDENPYTDFAGTITAITYPDEFSEYEGVIDLSEGFCVENQTPKPFGFSYRTLVGNDLQGDKHGYQVHVVYNVLASISTTTHETLNDASQPATFSWNITTIPSSIDDHRPTAHIIFDSRYLEPNILDTVEGFLYGAQFSNPHLPTINDFVNIILNWDPRIIIQNTTTGLSVLSPGYGDLTPSTISGLYVPLSHTRLSAASPAGFFTFVP